MGPSGMFELFIAQIPSWNPSMIPEFLSEFFTGSCRNFFLEFILDIFSAFLLETITVFLKFYPRNFCKISPRITEVFPRILLKGRRGISLWICSGLHLGCFSEILGCSSLDLSRSPIRYFFRVPRVKSPMYYREKKIHMMLSRVSPRISTGGFLGTLFFEFP